MVLHPLHPMILLPTIPQLSWLAEAHNVQVIPCRIVRIFQRVRVGGAPTCRSKLLGLQHPGSAARTRDCPNRYTGRIAMLVLLYCRGF